MPEVLRDRPRRQAGLVERGRDAFQEAVRGDDGDAEPVTGEAPVPGGVPRVPQVAEHSGKDELVTAAGLGGARSSTTQQLHDVRRNRDYSHAGRGLRMVLQEHSPSTSADDVRLDRQRAAVQVDGFPPKRARLADATARADEALDDVSQIEFTQALVATRPDEQFREPLSGTAVAPLAATAQRSEIAHRVASNRVRSGG